MSIVAVHTPNMVTSGAGGAGTATTIYDDDNMVMATASMTNGLIFTFEAVDKTRAAADYDWTFTGGTPASQANDKGPIEVTYATAGNKTANLTIPNAVATITTKELTSNVATLTTSAAHGILVGDEIVVDCSDNDFDGTFTVTAVTSTTVSYALTHIDVVSAAATGTITSAGHPAAGSYDIVVVAQEAQPRTLMAGGGPLGEVAVEEADVVEAEEVEEFDPADYTVEELIEFANDSPDQVADLLEAERAGKARVTLISHLESLLAQEETTE